MEAASENGVGAAEASGGERAEEARCHLMQQTTRCACRNHVSKADCWGALAALVMQMALGDMASWLLPPPVTETLLKKLAEDSSAALGFMSLGLPATLAPFPGSGRSILVPPGEVLRELEADLDQPLAHTVDAHLDSVPSSCAWVAVAFHGGYRRLPWRVVAYNYVHGAAALRLLVLHLVVLALRAVSSLGMVLLGVLELLLMLCFVLRHPRGAPTCAGPLWELLRQRGWAWLALTGELPALLAANACAWPLALVQCAVDFVAEADAGLHSAPKSRRGRAALPAWRLLRAVSPSWPGWLRRTLDYLWPLAARIVAARLAFDLPTKWLFNGGPMAWLRFQQACGRRVWYAARWLWQLIPGRLLRWALALLRGAWRLLAPAAALFRRRPRLPPEAASAFEPPHGPDGPAAATPPGRGARARRRPAAPKRVAAGNCTAASDWAAGFHHLARAAGVAAAAGAGHVLPLCGLHPPLDATFPPPPPLAGPHGAPFFEHPAPPPPPSPGPSPPLWPERVAAALWAVAPTAATVALLGVFLWPVAIILMGRHRRQRGPSLGTVCRAAAASVAAATAWAARCVFFAVAGAAAAPLLAAHALAMALLAVPLWAWRKLGAGLQRVRPTQGRQKQPRQLPPATAQAQSPAQPPQQEQLQQQQQQPKAAQRKKRTQQQQLAARPQQSQHAGVMRGSPTPPRPPESGPGGHAAPSAAHPSQQRPGGLSDARLGSDAAGAAGAASAAATAQQGHERRQQGQREPPALGQQQQVQQQDQQQQQQQQQQQGRGEGNRGSPKRESGAAGPVKGGAANAPAPLLAGPAPAAPAAVHRFPAQPAQPQAPVVTPTPAHLQQPPTAAAAAVAMGLPWMAEALQRHLAGGAAASHAAAGAAPMAGTHARVGGVELGTISPLAAAAIALARAGQAPRQPHAGGAASLAPLVQLASTATSSSATAAQQQQQQQRERRQSGPQAGKMCVVCDRKPRCMGFIHAPTIHCVTCDDCAATFAVGDPCPQPGCGLHIAKMIRVYTA